MLAASSSRSVLDCAGPEGARLSIHADDVRRAALEVGEPARPGDPFGLRIANAAVLGRLDLRAARIDVPLHFHGCAFDQAPRLDGAAVHELVIAGDDHDVEVGPVQPSLLPGLIADGLRVQHDLVLSRSTVAGRHPSPAAPGRTAAIWLAEAEIGGRLLAVGTVVDATGGRALHADRARIGGDVRLSGGFSAQGEVRLLGARVGGSVVLAGELTSPGSRALHLAEAQISGSVFMIRTPDSPAEVGTTVIGRIEMGRATIGGGLRIRDARLSAPPAGSSRPFEYHGEDVTDRALLVAPGLTVHGLVSIERDCVVEGALILSGAVLHSGAGLRGLRLSNPAGLALDLTQAQLGAGLDLRDSRIEGTVNLANARVTGPLMFGGARLSRPGGHYCVIGVAARVEGDVDLVELHTDGGGVVLRSSEISGVLNAEGARLINPGSESLSLHQARIQGNVRLCAGFTSVGLLQLTRSTIQGRLRCDGAVLEWANPQAGQQRPTAANPRAAAVQLNSAVVGSGIALGWQVRAGGVEFTDTRTSFLADDPAGDWPARSRLAGFTYQRFAALVEGQGEWSAPARAQWLARLEDYDPRPWDQAARVLRTNGDHAGAENLLIAQRRCERRRRIGVQSHWWRRALDRVADLSIGYGYRPERVLLIMLALIAAVSLSLSPMAGRSSMRAADPAGVVYSPAGALSGQGVAPAAGRCGGGKVRCFNPELYAIDTVIPIVDLKQRSTWYPGDDTGGAWIEWWLNLATILGWITSTVFALAFTRLGRTAGL